VQAGSTAKMPTAAAEQKIPLSRASCVIARQRRYFL